MRKQHRQLWSLPRASRIGRKLSIDNCSCSFHRYERCCPCCGAHGNIRGGQSVLYIWGQCLLPICAFSDSGIRTAHWLIALPLSSQVSLSFCCLSWLSARGAGENEIRQHKSHAGIDFLVSIAGLMILNVLTVWADVKEQSGRWKDGRFELSNFNVKLTPLPSVCSCLGFTVKNLFY